jgi:hypothetical protein
MRDKVLGQIVVMGETLTLHRRTYSSGNVAITAECEDGEPWTVLTVNLPESAQLDARGEFAVKTWSENEPMREPALASGLFVDTGRRIPAGFTEAEIWRLAA